ncbi:hypothetical protein [Rhizobium sp. ZPR3]|uniref:Uncharacterized protein n=2 Tax=unclassified Rhizobium TaxID=2613769 RepID=A0AAU7SK19_9HYPH
MKIGGAGVYSDDATDLGYVNAITRICEAFFVTGHHSQLYRIADGSWDWFHKGKLPQAPETYDYLIYGDLVGGSEDDIYMGVILSPTSMNRPLTEEEEAEMRRHMPSERRTKVPVASTKADFIIGTVKNGGLLPRHDPESSIPNRRRSPISSSRRKARSGPSAAMA